MREKYDIIEEDLISNYFLKKIQLKFNVIFLDPPYKEKRLSNIIDNIFQEKILNKDGVIIVHRHKKENDEFSKIDIFALHCLLSSLLVRWGLFWHLFLALLGALWPLWGRCRDTLG